MCRHPGFYLLPLFAIVWFTACRDTTKTAQQKEKIAVDSIVKKYLDLQNQMVPNRRFDEAMKVSDTLGLLARKYNSKQLQFEYLKSKGFVFNATGAFDSAIHYYNKAKAIIPALDNGAENHNKIKMSLAGVFKNQEKWKEAFDAYKSAYDYKKQTGDTDRAMVTYHLGIVARAMGNTELSKKHLLEALRYSAKPMVKTAIATAIQQYYLDSENIDSAKYYYSRYIATDTSFKNPLWLADREETKGRFLSLEGKTDAALAQYLKAISLQSAELGIGIAQSYLNAAIIYFHKKQYTRVVKYADSALLANKQQRRKSLTGKVNVEPDALYIKANAQRKTGHFREAAHNAIMAYDAYRAYADSFYAIKAKVLEQAYDSKTKDQQIFVLAKENRAAKKINYQQKVIVAGFLTLLLLLLFFGFSYYHRGQLKNKLQRMELEQRLLRSQIEPHFLFNTLGILQSFIRSGQTDKAIVYLSNFSNLLRTSLENSRKAYVLLEDEIRALKSYLEMQVMHSGSNFDYTISVQDEDMSSVCIYPMVIQPFVENAIQHGMKDIDYPGSVSIKIRKEHMYLECLIEDNGKGFASVAGSEKMLKHRTSLAIQITRERLALLGRNAGNKFSLQLQDKGTMGAGTGTLVTLRIPYRYEETR